jgi:hypothetical protein
MPLDVSHPVRDHVGVDGAMPSDAFQDVAEQLA